jgi:enoyl-CoA hydratase/carnithine racemase
MFDEFPLMAQEISKLEDIRCVVITGNGKHFSSGLDLKDPIFAMKLEDSAD